MKHLPIYPQSFQSYRFFHSKTLSARQDERVDYQYWNEGRQPILVFFLLGQSFSSFFKRFSRNGLLLENLFAFLSHRRRFEFLPYSARWRCAKSFFRFLVLCCSKLKWRFAFLTSKSFSNSLKNLRFSIPSFFAVEFCCVRDNESVRVNFHPTCLIFMLINHWRKILQFILLPARNPWGLISISKRDCRSWNFSFLIWWWE